MEEETSFVIVDGVVVPESVLLRQERGNTYGDVPGLPEEELADPNELERQVYIEEFGPVLALPVKGVQRNVRPAIDESGGVGWGAFGTIDFERGMPGFDKIRYRADKLREERDNVLIMLSIVARRLPLLASRQVLKYVRMGLIELEHVIDEDMLALAKLTLKALALQREIATLRNMGKATAERTLAVLLA